MIQVINDRMIVVNNDIKLGINSMIEFKPAASVKKRSGTITQFWNKGEGSIWANVKDPSDGYEECISMKLWNDHLDNGIVRH